MISADILRGANFFGNPQERGKTGAKHFFKLCFFFNCPTRDFLIPFLPHFQKFRLQNTSYGRSERLIDCIQTNVTTKSGSPIGSFPKELSLKAKKSKFSIFSKAILLLHFPSVFLPCSLV